jgi:hypothetical protein
MLLNTSSKNLFKAASITQEIESLEALLQSLLYEENDSAAVDVDKAVSPPAPNPKGKISKPSTGKTTRRKNRVVTGLAKNVGDAIPEEKAAAPVSELEEVTARRQRNSGKVAELPAVKSTEPTRGGLAQAIREVLAASAKPRNVSSIYDALVAGGYVFSFADPKKGLSMRMYRMKGVKPLGKGMFGASKD